MSLQVKKNNSLIHQIIIWFIAVLIIVLGIYLTNIKYMDTEWLSRSGCLIVILGIWSGLGIVIQERIIYGRIRWRRRNAITRSRAELEEQGFDSAVIEKKIHEINDSFDQNYAELKQDLRYSLGVLEFSLLITGTFLWGFGDLLIG